MLQALVSEMNLYSESPSEAIKWLNIRLDLGESRMETYLIRQLVVAGKDITEKVRRPTWYGNPATNSMVEIHVYSEGWVRHQSWEVQFSPRSHLKSGNVTSGEYVFEDDLRRTKAVLLRSASHSPMALAKLLVH